MTQNIQKNEKNIIEKRPLISVIVIVMNEVKFISQTLKSILGQDYENFEVIVQDGASTDGT